MSVASAPVPGPFVPAGEPEIRDLGPTTETVWNCGSGGGTVVKHPAMSVVSNYAVEWQVGGTGGAGVRIGDGVIPGGVDLSATLEGHYTTGFEQGIQQGTGWDLPAEPNTVVVYTLMWREVWQPGYVDVRLADQSVVRVNVRCRTGIQSEIVGKQPQTCGEQQQVPTEPSDVQPRPTLVMPTPVPIEGVGPLRDHIATSIGTGAFADVTLSDGQAPYDENWLWANDHFNIQRIRREENPNGCGVAQYQVSQIWISVAAVAKVTVNGSEIGTITTITPLQTHGYIASVSLNVGDEICVTPIPGGGFHIIFGPDVYYHYDSYCYRGHC